jgi:hypothetical protein
MEPVRLGLMVLAYRLFCRLARSSTKRTPATFEVPESSTVASICASQAPTLSLGTVTDRDGGSRLPWLCNVKLMH